MPCVQVVAEMELAGISFDLDYADRLRVKYEAILNKIDKLNENGFKDVVLISDAHNRL